MSWKIEFYNAKVKDEIFEWPKHLQAKFLDVVDRIQQIGLDGLGMPHIKALKKGLFEMRIKSDEGIGRVIFCIMTKKIIIILNGFIKKTQKTPMREIEIAQKRMKEVKNDEK